MNVISVLLRVRAPAFVSAAGTRRACRRGTTYEPQAYDAALAGGPLVYFGYEGYEQSGRLR
jgi:hypothetical protein